MRDHAAAMGIVPGAQVTIRPGYGYWDTSFHPAGGNFKRAPRDGTGVVVTVARTFERAQGCDLSGTTADGKTVALSIEVTQEYETARLAEVRS